MNSHKYYLNLRTIDKTKIENILSSLIVDMEKLTALILIENKLLEQHAFSKIRLLIPNKEKLLEAVKQRGAIVKTLPNISRIKSNLLESLTRLYKKLASVIHKNNQLCQFLYQIFTLSKEEYSTNRFYSNFYA